MTTLNKHEACNAIHPSLEPPSLDAVYPKVAGGSGI